MSNTSMSCYQCVAVTRFFNLDQNYQNRLVQVQLKHPFLEQTLYSWTLLFLWRSNLIEIGKTFSQQSVLIAHAVVTDEASQSWLSRLVIRASLGTLIDKRWQTVNSESTLKPIRSLSRFRLRNSSFWIDCPQSLLLALIPPVAITISRSNAVN